jgi:hypothetical protein
MDSLKLSRVLVISSFIFLVLLISSSTVQSLRFFDRMFSFGDSNTDVAYSGSLHLPYGETYFHKPTGRNSDGRIIVDFFGIYF